VVAEPPAVPELRRGACRPRPHEVDGRADALHWLVYMASLFRCQGAAARHAPARGRILAVGPPPRLTPPGHGVAPMTKSRDRCQVLQCPGSRQRRPSGGLMILWGARVPVKPPVSAPRRGCAPTAAGRPAGSRRRARPAAPRPRDRRRRRRHAERRPG
jgi:hypothetical protein